MSNFFGSKKFPLVQTSNGGGADFGWISKSVEINGNVVFSDKLQVDGKVTGLLHSEKGTLIIGESGNLEAQIDVGTCVIHGLINGNIKARTKVEIHRTGRVYGDITTPALTMEDGSLCNGAIRMVREVDSKAAPKGNQIAKPAIAGELPPASSNAPVTNDNQTATAQPERAGKPAVSSQ